MARIPVPRKNDYDTIREWLLLNNHISTEEIARLSCLSINKIREWKVQCDVVDQRDEGLFRVWLKYKSYSVAEACILLGISHRSFKYYLNKYKITKYKTHSRQFYRMPRRECPRVGLPKTREEMLDLMQSYGRRLLARMTGASTSRIYKLTKKYGIKVNRDNHNDCNNKEWLIEHYFNKKMSLKQCAELAGVVPHTIRNWMIVHKMTPRSYAFL